MTALATRTFTRTLCPGKRSLNAGFGLPGHESGHCVRVNGLENAISAYPDIEIGPEDNCKPFSPASAKSPPEQQDRDEHHNYHSQHNHD